MKARSLTSCILLPILVIFLLSTAAQATEYSKADTEVKAEEILKHIENEDDIVLDNCSIVGELNVSTINLKTVPNPLFDELLEEGYTKEEIIFDYGLIDKLNVIESNITIINSTFGDGFDSLNSQFNGSVNFSYTNFNRHVYFNKTVFISATNFDGANFNNSAAFSIAYFYSDSNFSHATFNRSADFSDTNFNDDANFEGVNFNGYANFSHATFNNPSDFVSVTFISAVNFDGTTFKSYVDFYAAYFNGDASFSAVNFYSYANFDETTFNGVRANFDGANFSDYANFDDADFHSFADFGGARFNYTDFSDVNFYIGADFSVANFNSYANFNDTNFNYALFIDANISSISFEDANFNGSSFSGANFNSDANLAANFNNYAFFNGVNFNSDANLWLSYTSSENIITDGKTCKFFMESYNNEARYTDADNIYYNYRKNEERSKNTTDFSKWTDILSWITCGYGTKLSYPLSWTAIFVMLFAIIYKNPLIYCKNQNKKKFMGICLGKPGIYRKNEEGKSVSFLECLYFSINTFTRLGSANWQQRDGFSKWVSLEGFLGWIIFALVSATLMRLFIRP